MKRVGVAILFSVLIIGCSSFQEKASPVSSTQVYNAILIDDNYLLNKYLSENPDLTEEQLNILLLRSLDNNSLKSLKTLLDRGANVNYLDVKNGKTPIFYVRSINALNLLINEGAYINIENSDKESLLSYFIRNKNLKYSQLLIEKGAILSSWDILLSATLAGSPLLIKNMINHGADFTQIDEFGNYPIYYAYSEEIINTLLEVKYYNLNQVNKRQENVLGEVYLRAVANDYVNIVDKILKLGINPYYMSYGDNALIIAKNSNNKDMLKFLKSKGLN